MLQTFKEYIAREQLLHPYQRILVAVSGGMDSIVLLDLLYRAGYKIAVAHCNFQLRGRASDLDELFVRNLALKYEVPVFVKRFKTEKYAEQHKISIQMAARDLRYTWFEKLLEEEKFDAYATAHHLDDQIETFFINIFRGTGIGGLHGINPRQGNCVRPLLYATRNEIEVYRRSRHLSYREDESNQSDKYLRNKIRLRLLPVIQEILPDYNRVFYENLNRFREIEKIYKRDIAKKAGGLMLRNPDGSVHIPIDELINLYPVRTYLFEILSTFGFTTSDAMDIFEALEAAPGKQFFSATHRLLKDRDFLILTEIKDDSSETSFYINDEMLFIKDPVHLQFSKRRYQIEKSLPREPFFACLDYDKLDFPLQLRKWKKGDIFCPLGMKKNKKLSDFFIDEKFSIYEKENQWVLMSGDEICWIVGCRIDDRFKVTTETKKIFEIQLAQCSV